MTDEPLDTTVHFGYYSIGSSLVDKVQAIRQYLFHRRFNGAFGDRLRFPSFGIVFFLLFGVVILFILTFAVRPYYRQHRPYDSPTLAIRTGLMAVSLMPLLVVLSEKANLVTLLAVLGHKKLNVFHHWVGWSMFGFNVAHTVPYIVAPLHDGGYAALHKQFYKPGGFKVKESLMLRNLWLLILGQHTGVPAWGLFSGSSSSRCSIFISDSARLFTSRTSSLL